MRNKKENKIIKEEKMYFDENLAQECILKYQSSKDMNDLSPLYHQFVLQATGMLNKQFYANSFIQNNKEDAIANAIYEIYKSLQKFDLSKGKVFPYTNRIIKNTFLIYHQKLLKQSCEISIYNLQNDNNNDDNNEDEIFGYVTTNDNTEPNDLISKSSYTGNPVKCFDYINDKDEYKLEDIEFVYSYFKSIYDKLNVLISNKKELITLINTLQENLESELIYETNNTIVDLFKKKTSIDYKYQSVFKIVHSSISLLEWIENNYNINKNTSTYKSLAFISIPKSLIKKITFIKNNIFKNNIPDYVNIKNLVETILYIDRYY